MDRQYKAPHVVNVYLNQADKDAGRAHKRIKRVPYSSRGFDNYDFDGRVYPGYLDSVHTDVDSCIILGEKA